MLLLGEIHTQQFAHKILFELPLTEPELPTTTPFALTSMSRTKIGQANPQYAYTTKHGVRIPCKALPGATVMLDVQDISRLEEDLVPLVKWYCMHRECGAHKRYDRKEDLHRAHAKQKDLVATAKRDPNGQAHVYIGILEIAATTEVKEEKTGKVIKPAQLATCMLVSDVE